MPYRDHIRYIATGLAIGAAGSLIIVAIFVVWRGV